MTAAFYRAVFFTSAGLLLLAAGSMPWGYYQTLHWLVPAAGAVVIIRAVRVKRHAWVVLGALSIIFFFPLFGVYLDKQTNRSRGTWQEIAATA